MKLTYRAKVLVYAVVMIDNQIQLRMSPTTIMITQQFRRRRGAHFFRMFGSWCT
jgi:hypothetical protein